MPERKYSQPEYDQRIKWIAGGIIVAFVVGFFFGFGTGKDVSDQRVRQEGISEGIEIGRVKGRTEGIGIGKIEGERIGRAKGGRQGYARGFEDKAHGRPNALQSLEAAELGKLRYESRITYLLIAGIAAAVLTLFWLPFIYFDAALPDESVGFRTRLRAWMRSLGDKAQRNAFLVKVLVSAVTVVAAGIFLPSELLGIASADLFDATLSEIGVVAIGLAASTTLLAAMLWSTAATEGRLRFWLQIMWAVVFPILFYEFFGSVAAAGRVHTTYGVKMLHLQVGTLIASALLLSYVLLVPGIISRLRATRRRRPGYAA